MSLCKNTIQESEITSVPIKLKYSQTSSCGGDEGILFIQGYNGEVDYSGSVNQSILLYRKIRQLYYMGAMSGSLYNSASAWDNYAQSTAASGTFEYEAKYFPTQSGAKISVMHIPRNLFGERVSPTTFTYSSGSALLTDDGNGNVLDIASDGKLIGNIIYAHGTVIITDQNYQDVFPKSPVLMDYYGSFYDNVSPKTFNVITGVDNVGQGSFDYSTLNFFGTDQSHLFSANPSTGQVTIAAKDAGTYTSYYNIKNSFDDCGLISNTAKCTITVNKYVYDSLAGMAKENDCRITGSAQYNDCEFAGVAYIIPNPTPSITPSITITKSVTKTPSVTRTPSRTATITPTISLTPTISITPTTTPTITITTSVTPTQFLSLTPTISITNTPLPTISVTPTISITPTITVTKTPTISITPSISVSPTNAWNLCGTLTATPSDRYVNLKYRNRVSENPNGGFIVLASQDLPNTSCNQLSGTAGGAAIVNAEVYIAVATGTLISVLQITDSGGTRSASVGSGIGSYTFTNVNGNFTVTYTTKINCIRYQNASYSANIIVNYIDCSGVSISNALVVPRDTFCAKLGSVSYTGQGFPQQTTQTC